MNATLKPENPENDEATQISVVIPTFNRPDKLKACLLSLSRQTLSTKDFEVVVVDDGSDMDLSQVTTPFKEHFQLRLMRQDNAGPASARNAGVGAAMGRFIALTDDDCLLHEDWLSIMLRNLQNKPGVLFGGKTINQLDGNIYSLTSQLLIDHLYDYHTKKSRNLMFFTSNNMALARAGFLNCGGFNEDFPTASGEDREFCDRWLHAGNGLEFEPGATVYHGHDLKLGSFCELHFRYGKGAKRFWRCRTKRGQESLTIGKLAFYASLIPLPWKRGLSRPWSVFCLLTLSQLVNVAGYFSQRD